MHLSWTRLPFKYRSAQEFRAALTDYVGQSFYETLPAAGYEVREEQIYTSFRIAGALCSGTTMLAEAGLGTGKTFAYLIPALCHARDRGKPVVVACSSGVLREQLAAPGGDCAALSRLLGLEIEARQAKDPEHHLCEIKVDALRRVQVRLKGRAKLLRWADSSKLGDRSEVPDVPDALWDLVAWDAGLACDTCKRRGYCRLARSRDLYHEAGDLVICSHELFLRDLWTRKERRASGLRPLLPEYSGVVFDEGHRIPDMAQVTAGHHIDTVMLFRTMDEVRNASDRQEYLLAADHARLAAMNFQALLTAAVKPAETERLHVERTEGLLRAARELAERLVAIQDRLATEEQMWEGTSSELYFLSLQSRLDEVAAALDLLRASPAETVAWALRTDRPGFFDLWVVPRRPDRMLERELYRRGIPVVYSSATLAGSGSFAYLQRMIGAPHAETSQVGTSFDLGSQAMVYLPGDSLSPLTRMMEVLVSSAREVELVRKALVGQPFAVLCEGDAERAELLRRFKSDVSSVLVGRSYWEGIDVPGEALSCVVVLRLPFAEMDPVLAARREDALAEGLDAFAAVDLPAMVLRLKQGRGRLIRTSTDRGVFALLDTSFVGTDWEAAVRNAFPEDSPVVSDLKAVRRFLGVPS